MSRSSHQRQQQKLQQQQQLLAQQQQMAENDAAAAAAEMFDLFCVATTMRQVLGLHRNMCDLVGLRPAPLNEFYPKLKAKIRSWKGQALWKKLDARAAHRAYSKGTAATGTRVLVIGAGPCGLRTAIEAQLLGAKVVVVEKRDRISRNNVLHLWPFVITDLRNLGAKKFYGKFCAGSIDHISIRQLQCILLKVALLLGVEVHEGVSFDGSIEPNGDGCGWRAAVSPDDHAVSHYEFDVLIGADGKRNTLEGFKRKEFRGKLAIAITANFINKKTEAEAKAEEISGVAFIFNQSFFKELYHTTGIDLENIVYYKDETHYFVMTAKKHSLIDKGVIMQDFADPAELLAPPNVNTEKLLDYAREAAEFSTKYQMPNLEFAVNHYGKPDVAMFDFTSMFASETSCRVIVRKGFRLLQCLVGDSLLEPFWPTGSGCARGFLSSMDAAYAIKLWSNVHNSTLGVLAQRESIYRLLNQTTPENLQRDIGSYTVDPATRYPNLNRTSVNVWQVKHLIDTDDNAILEQTFMDTNALQATQVDTPVRRKRRSGDSMPLSAVLLRWICAQLHSYEFTRSLKEVSDVFTHGKVLCALINRYRPDLVDYNAIKDLPAIECNDIAFKVLDKELNIPRIMSGKDAQNLNTIESKVWLNYLEQICEVFRGEIPHVKHPKMDFSELREKYRFNTNVPPDFSKLLQLSTKQKSKSPMQDMVDTTPQQMVQRRSVLDEDKLKRQRKQNPIDVTAATTSAAGQQGQADTPRRAKKRRSAEKAANIEERQKRLQEIESNRQDRQSKRRQQRYQQTQNFYKSLHMLQANTLLRESDDATPFEDYSIFLYRQQAPIFNDRVKELERKLLFPDRERCDIPSALPRNVTDEQFSDRIKSMEQRIISKNSYGTEKKPKDLMRAIGKIDSSDWNVREIEKKIEQSKKTEIHGPKGREKVPKWSKEQFMARHNKMSKPMRQDSGEEKFKEIDQTLKNLDKQLKEGSVLEVGERGRNKVASIAGQFVKKDDTSDEKNPPTVVHKSSSKVALAFKKQAASEKCHFCKQTVYLMEKINTEGLILHRSCLKCHHCQNNLRPGGYAFDRDDPNGRFYCTQHFRLPAKAIRPVVRKAGQRKPTQQQQAAAAAAATGADVNAGVEGEPKTPDKLRGHADSVAQLDLLDRGQTPERIEFENTDAMSDGEPSEEHIIDENEWSGRNFLPESNNDSESDLTSSDDSDSESDSDIFEEANDSPLGVQTLQLATDWIGKQNYSESDDSDDFYDSSDGIADDGKDDTEGEEFKKARELRREEVRLLPLPANLPTDTETELKLSVNENKENIETETLSPVPPPAQQSERQQKNLDLDKFSEKSVHSEKSFVSAASSLNCESETARLPPTTTKTDMEKIEQSSDRKFTTEIDDISEKLYRLNNIVKLNKDLESMAKENLVQSDIKKKLTLKEKWLADNNVGQMKPDATKSQFDAKMEKLLRTSEVAKKSALDAQMQTPKPMNDDPINSTSATVTESLIPQKSPTVEKKHTSLSRSNSLKKSNQALSPAASPLTEHKNSSAASRSNSFKSTTSSSPKSTPRSVNVSRTNSLKKPSSAKGNDNKIQLENILDIVKKIDISGTESKVEESADIGKLLYDAESKFSPKPVRGMTAKLKEIEAKSFAGTMDTIKSQMVVPTISSQAAPSVDLSKYFPNQKQEKASSQAINKTQKNLKDVDLTKYFPSSPVPQKRSSVVTVAEKLKKSQTEAAMSPVVATKKPAIAATTSVGTKVAPKRQASMGSTPLSLREHQLDGALDVAKKKSPVVTTSTATATSTKKGNIKIIKKIVPKGTKAKRAAEADSERILDEILHDDQEFRSPSLEYKKLFDEEKSPSEDISDKIERILEETGIDLGIPSKPASDKRKMLHKAKSLGEGEFERNQGKLSQKTSNVSDATREDGDPPVNGVQNILRRFESMSSVKSEEHAFKLQRMESSTSNLNKSRESLISRESDSMSDLEKTMEYLKTEWRSEATNFLQKKRDSFYAQKRTLEEEAAARIEEQKKTRLNELPVQYRESKLAKFFGIKPKSPEKKRSPAKKISPEKKKSPEKKRSPEKKKTPTEGKKTISASATSSDKKSLDQQEYRNNLKSASPTSRTVKMLDEKTSSVQMSRKNSNDVEEKPPKPSEIIAKLEGKIYKPQFSKKLSTKGEESFSNLAKIDSKTAEASKKNSIESLVNGKETVAPNDEVSITVKKESPTNGQTEESVEFVKTTKECEIKNEIANPPIFSAPRNPLETESNNTNVMECLQPIARTEAVAPSVGTERAELSIPFERVAPSTPTENGRPLVEDIKNLPKFGCDKSLSNSRRGSQTSLQSRRQSDASISEKLEFAVEELARKNAADSNTRIDGIEVEMEMEQQLKIQTIQSSLKLDTDVADAPRKMAEEPIVTGSDPKDERHSSHSLSASSSVPQVTVQLRGSSEDESIEKLFGQFSDNMLVDVEFDSNDELVSINPRATLSQIEDPDADRDILDKLESLEKDPDVVKENVAKLTTAIAPIKDPIQSSVDIVEENSTEPVFPMRPQRRQKSSSSSSEPSVPIAPQRIKKKLLKLDPADMPPSVQDVLHEIYTKQDANSEVMEAVPLKFPQKIFEDEGSTNLMTDTQATNSHIKNEIIAGEINAMDNILKQQAQGRLSQDAIKSKDYATKMDPVGNSNSKNNSSAKKSPIAERRSSFSSTLSKESHSIMNSNEDTLLNVEGFELSKENKLQATPQSLPDRDNLVVNANNFYKTMDQIIGELNRGKNNTEIKNETATSTAKESSLEEDIRNKGTETDIKNSYATPTMVVAPSKPQEIDAEPLFTAKNPSDTSIQSRDYDPQIFNANISSTEQNKTNNTNENNLSPNSILVAKRLQSNDDLIVEQSFNPNRRTSVKYNESETIIQSGTSSASEMPSKNINIPNKNDTATNLQSTEKLLQEDRIKQVRDRRPSQSSVKSTDSQISNQTVVAINKNENENNYNSSTQNITLPISQTKEKSLDWDMEKILASPMPRRKFVHAERAPYEETSKKDVSPTSTIKILNELLQEDFVDAEHKERRMLEKIEKERQQAVLKRDQEYAKTHKAVELIEPKRRIPQTTAPNPSPVAFLQTNLVNHESFCNKSTPQITPTNPSPTTSHKGSIQGSLNESIQESVSSSNKSGTPPMFKKLVPLPSPTPSLPPTEISRSGSVALSIRSDLPQITIAPMPKVLIVPKTVPAYVPEPIDENEPIPEVFKNRPWPKPNVNERSQSIESDDDVENLVLSLRKDRTSLESNSPVDEVFRNRPWPTGSQKYNDKPVDRNDYERATNFQQSPSPPLRRKGSKESMHLKRRSPHSTQSLKAIQRPRSSQSSVDTDPNSFSTSLSVDHVTSLPQRQVTKSHAQPTVEDTGTRLLLDYGKHLHNRKREFMNERVAERNPYLKTMQVDIDDDEDELESYRPKNHTSSSSIRKFPTARTLSRPATNTRYDYISSAPTNFSGYGSGRHLYTSTIPTAPTTRSYLNYPSHSSSYTSSALGTPGRTHFADYFRRSPSKHMSGRSELDKESCVQSDSESTSSNKVEQNSATEISTDSEFDHDEIIREAPKIFIDDSHLRKPTKVHVKSSITPNIGQKYNTATSTVMAAQTKGSSYLQKYQSHKQLQPQFKPLVQVDPTVLCTNRIPLQNPRPGEYLLNKTASTEGIASKKSLELKKRYLLGEQANGNKIQKSGSTSVLDSKIRSFHSNISECQKLLNPSNDISPSMKTFLDRTKLGEHSSSDTSNIMRCATGNILNDLRVEITIQKASSQASTDNEKENLFVNSKNELNKGVEYSETVNTALVESLRKNSPTTPTNNQTIIDTIDLITPEKKKPIIDLTEVEIPTKMLESNVEFINNIDVLGQRLNTDSNKIVDLTCESPVKSDRTVIDDKKPDVSKDIKECIPDIIEHIEICDVKSDNKEAALCSPSGDEQQLLLSNSYDEEKKDSPEKHVANDFESQDLQIQVPNIPWGTRKPENCSSTSASSCSSNTSSIEDIQHYILESTTSPDTQTGHQVPRLEVHDTAGELMQIDSLMIVDGRYVGDPEDLKLLDIPEGLIIPELPDIKTSEFEDELDIEPVTATPEPAERTVIEADIKEAPPLPEQGPPLPERDPPKIKPTDLKFDTRNENKVESLKNLPLIVEQLAETNSKSVKPMTLNLINAQKSPNTPTTPTPKASTPLSPLIDNDKTPTADLYSRGSDSETEATGTGQVLTETELSDWTADDCISENFIDIEFVLNSNQNTIKRSKKGKKKKVLNAYKQLPTAKGNYAERAPMAPVAEFEGILRNLDIDEIEFMDTGSEGSCAEAYSATNTAMLRNRGYIEFIETSPKSTPSHKANDATMLKNCATSKTEKYMPVSTKRDEVLGIDYIEQGAYIMQRDDSHNDLLKTPVNEQPLQTKSVENSFQPQPPNALTQSLTDSSTLNDLDDDSIGVMTSATMTKTTTDESEALTVVTSPLNSSSPKIEEILVAKGTLSTPSSSDKNPKTSTLSTYTPTSASTASSSNATSPRKSSTQEAHTSVTAESTPAPASTVLNTAQRHTADELSYEEYVRALQQKITQISSARDSLDTRKQRRKSSKGEAPLATFASDTQTVIEQTRTSGGSCDSQSLTPPKSEVARTLTSENDLVAQTPAALAQIHKVPEIPTLTSRLEEITKERTKQKDLIHDLVMDKLQSKKQLNAEKRLHRSRQRSLLTSGGCGYTSASSLSPTPKLAAAATTTDTNCTSQAHYHVSTSAASANERPKLNERSSSSSFKENTPLQKSATYVSAYRPDSGISPSRTAVTLINKQRPFSEHVDVEPLDALERYRLTKTPSFSYTMSTSRRNLNSQQPTKEEKQQLTNSIFSTSIAPLHSNRIHANGATAVSPALAGEDELCITATAASTEKLRTDARARARLKSNNELGLSPEEKMQLLRKRLHLEESITTAVSPSTAALYTKVTDKVGTQQFAARDHKMSSSKSVNDLVTAAALYTSKLNSCAADENSNTTQSAVIADFTSDPNLMLSSTSAQAAVAKPLKEAKYSVRRQKDPERRKSIIQSLSSFFHMGTSSGNGNKKDSLNASTTASAANSAQPERPGTSGSSTTTSSSVDGVFSRFRITAKSKERSKDIKDGGIGNTSNRNIATTSTKSQYERSNSQDCILNTRTPNNNSKHNNYHHKHLRSSSTAKHSTSSPQLFVTKNNAATAEEQIPPPIPPLPLHYQRSDDESYATETREQKKQRSISKAMRQAELKRLRIAQEIQREQEEIEVQLKELEARGVLIEKALRGEGQHADSFESSSNMIGASDEKLLKELLEIWRNITQLKKRDDELSIRQQELQLEHRHAQLKEELNIRLSNSKLDKSSADVAAEGAILNEMLEIVAKRAALRPTSCTSATSPVDNEVKNKHVASVTGTSAPSNFDSAKIAASKIETIQLNSIVGQSLENNESQI